MVPAQLAARARLLNSGHARKTDALDAASVTAVAVHHPRLRLVRAEDHSVGLRLLSDRRMILPRNGPVPPTKRLWSFLVHKG